MGLSSYGKLNSNIPNLYKNTKGNSCIIDKSKFNTYFKPTTYF
jgi:hypothetical protein